MRQLRLALVLVVGLIPNALAQQTNCRSYWVGNVLYTSCDGQPGRPAAQQPTVGVDTSSYKQPPPPKVDSPIDIMLKAEALKNLRLQNEAASKAAPTSSPPPIASPAAPSIDATIDLIMGKLDGNWWIGIKRLADKGDNLALMTRYTTIRGILDGAEFLLMTESPSIDAFNARRPQVFRSDLTFEQIASKIDGYYAEPSQIDKPLSLAVMLAVRPTDKQQ